MFAEVAGVEHADVVYGDDGRSRVRFNSVSSVPYSELPTSRVHATCVFGAFECIMQAPDLLFQEIHNFDSRASTLTILCFDIDDFFNFHTVTGL